jgi:hypothetical protein
MKKYFMYLLIVFILFGCQNTSISEDERRLDTFFKEVLNLDISIFDKKVIVFISGNCGACTDKTIKFLKRVGEDKKTFAEYHKIVVIPENNAYVLDSLKSLDINFYIQESYVLDKYGVNFPKNLFFDFKHNNLVFREWLSQESIDSVAKRYDITL